MIKFDSIQLLFVKYLLDSPLNNPESVEAKVLILFDIIVTSLFTAEMLLKFFAFG